MAAVRLLKSVSDKGAIKELKQWVSTHEGKALTPAAIRLHHGCSGGQTRQSVSARTASRSRSRTARSFHPRRIGFTVDVSNIGPTPEQLEGMRSAEEVDDVLDAIDKPVAEAMKRDYQRYAEAFTKADAALRRYRSELHNIINLKGTDYLDQLRAYESSADWIQRGRERREHGQPGMGGPELQAICELLTTRRGPTEFNFNDPDLVDVDPVD